MAAVAAFVAYRLRYLDEDFKRGLKFKSLLSIELSCGLERLHFSKVRGLSFIPVMRFSLTSLRRIIVLIQLSTGLC